MTRVCAVVRVDHGGFTEWMVSADSQEGVEEIAQELALTMYHEDAEVTAEEIQPDGSSAHISWVDCPEVGDQ